MPVLSSISTALMSKGDAKIKDPEGIFAKLFKDPGASGQQVVDMLQESVWDSVFADDEDSWESEPADKLSEALGKIKVKVTKSDDGFSVKAECPDGMSLKEYVEKAVKDNPRPTHTSWLQKLKNKLSPAKKEAALRKGLIRLAHQRPEYRAEILDVLDYTSPHKKRTCQGHSAARRVQCPVCASPMVPYTGRGAKPGMFACMACYKRGRDEIFFQERGRQLVPIPDPT